jgi:hypothetical protein
MVWPLLQGGDCRRVHGCSVANGGDGFQCHVAPCDGPLIVLLQHQGSDQAGDGGFVWKDADDVGPPLDFLVEALKRVRGVDLRPVFPGKSLVGEHVVLGAAHQVSELWMAWREGVDQLGPVTFRSCKRVLIKGCSERGRDDRAVFLADAGQRVPHEVDPAALDSRPKHLGRGGFQPLVIVSDDQTGAAQAAIGEGTEEFIPEHLCLAGLDGNAQNLSAAIQIDRHGHYGRYADDAAGPAHPDVGGVEPRHSPSTGSGRQSISPHRRDLALGHTAQ